LLQVLEDGRLTDGQGRTVDFCNTVIVMTSNMGSDLIQSMTDIDQYDFMRQQLMQVVTTCLRPELLNRIDEVVVFHPLGKDELRAIVTIQLRHLTQRLQEHELQL
jgi:ATP-dependent Clp protease ATP-binding subunit ClpB